MSIWVLLYGRFAKTCLHSLPKTSTTTFTGNSSSPSYLLLSGTSICLLKLTQLHVLSVNFLNSNTRFFDDKIGRDDITFTDPLNTFTGIENYKLIFWALRFHGRILFREIGVDVLRVWQPSENVILIRWNLRGIPRVPWEAKGQFQGTSRYKLDRNGKIYEHKVDNLAFNFPQQLKPAVSVLDLVAACPASPNPTFFLGPVDVNPYSSSWVELYRAVREALDREKHLTLHDHLVPCS